MTRAKQGQLSWILRGGSYRRGVGRKLMIQDTVGAK